MLLARDALKRRAPREGLRWVGRMSTLALLSWGRIGVAKGTRAEVGGFLVAQWGWRLPSSESDFLTERSRVQEGDSWWVLEVRSSFLQILLPRWSS